VRRRKARFTYGAGVGVGDTAAVVQGESVGIRLGRVGRRGTADECRRSVVRGRGRSQLGEERYKSEESEHVDCGAGGSRVWTRTRSTVLVCRVKSGIGFQNRVGSDLLLYLSETSREPGSMFASRCCVALFTSRSRCPRSKRLLPLREYAVSTPPPSALPCRGFDGVSLPGQVHRAR
jgi:hypothetical protein